MEILCKGLTFVPTARFSTFSWIRKLKWNTFFQFKNVQEAQSLWITFNDLAGVRMLSARLDEGEGIRPGAYTSLKPKSTRMPLLMECPII